jgi:uncharacterized protein YecE (DUF72 family)
MILVGTSGWQYDDWRRRFYPHAMPTSRWLEYFSSVFPTVEVNNSFYRLPAEATFDRWRVVTPEDFVVTVKASRYITHIKRLREAAEPLELLWSRCSRLGAKLGPVLFQLPPRFAVDAPRLRRFVELLPKDMRAAFEFRDRSWETDEVFSILDDSGAALVLADHPDREPSSRVCGAWSYVRLHAGSRTRPGYSRVKLARWADRLIGLGSVDVYVYFNNDTGGAALRNAATFTRLLGDRGADVRGPSPDLRPVGDEDVRRAG